jgi:hypothetical protein
VKTPALLIVLPALVVQFTAVLAPFVTVTVAARVSCCVKYSGLLEVPVVGGVIATETTVGAVDPELPEEVVECVPPHAARKITISMATPIPTT